jgi:hypothetical protein
VIDGARAMNDARNPAIGRTGPDDTGTGNRALLGAAAVIIWNDVAVAGRDEFYEWHDKEHIPERLAIPGFRRGRRYGKRGHSPEYLTLYEAGDTDIVVSPPYLERLNAPTPATVATLRHFRKTSRAVCRVVDSIGSSSGGYVLALRIEVPEDAIATFSKWMNGALTRAYALTGVVACHLFTADQDASRVNTAESSTRAFDIPSWVVLVEASDEKAAERSRVLIESPELLALGATVRSDAAVYTLEICRLAAWER